MQELERSDIAALRIAMGKLGLVVAEIDLDLRYVWIDNPHPDFDAAAAIGKRDDELIPASEAKEIMSLKQEVISRASRVHRVLVFERSDGRRYYSMSAYPVWDSKGQIDGIVTVGVEARGRSRPDDVLSHMT